jgi:hypothetical protein
MRYDHSERKPIWPKIVGGGCCLLLVVALPFSTYIYLVLGSLWFDIKERRQDRVPVESRLEGYSFTQRSNASSCSIRLPDGEPITYMEVYPTGGSGHSDRAVELNYLGNKVVRPLLQAYREEGTYIDLYWYPRRGYSGPYVRVKDTDEQIIDLGQGVTRSLTRFETYAYSAVLWKGEETESGYRVAEHGWTDVTFNHVPADDVTSVFGFDDGRLIGSIGWRGNKLAFEPSKVTSSCGSSATSPRRDKRGHKQSKGPNSWLDGWKPSSEVLPQDRH